MSEGSDQRDRRRPGRRELLPGAIWTMLTYTLALLTVWVAFFWPPAVPELDFQGDVPGFDAELFAGDRPDDGTAAQLRRIRESVPAEVREMENPVPLTSEVLRRGRSLYANMCASCHGQQGNADVPIARTLNPPPVDFTHPAFAALEPGVTFHIIANGSPGSSMAPFRTTLSEEEIWTLVHFLRETFPRRTEDEPATPSMATAVPDAPRNDHIRRHGFPGSGFSDGDSRKEDETPAPFHGFVLDPPVPAPEFTLVDHRGEPFRLHQLRGDVAVLYFGYTDCPDACPATLTYYGDVQRALGEAARRVHFLFVTVHPERDTPEKMAAYLQHFSARITGLTGSPEAIRQIVDRYGIYVAMPGVAGARAHYGPPGSHIHTTLSIVIDKRGRIRLAHDVSPDPRFMATDLARLLDER